MPHMPNHPQSDAPADASSWMASAAILMVFATFMSGLTGLLRDVVIAQQFGRQGPINAYHMAFSLPDLLYFLVAGGALRTGFVPVFTQYLAQGKREQAWRTFSALFWLLALAAGLLSGVGMLIAEPLARLISPGWVADYPDLLGLCAWLMRIMFPAQIFFALGGLLMGTLNAQRHFLWPGMGPIIYNCAIIAGAVLAPVLFGLPTLAYAVLVGAFLGNFAVQMGALQRRGGKLAAVWAPTDEGVRRVLVLALPVMLGLAIAEINFVITKALATHTDPEAGVSTLQYANRLWKFPARIFGAGIAIALFPALAHDYARGEEGQYRRDFSFGMRNVLFLSIPATALIVAMRTPIVRLLYEGRSIDAAGVQAVATVLLWYSFGIIPLGVLYVAARAFYARQDMVTPVWVGGISVAVCVVSALLLAGPYGVAGLAMATSLAGVINTVLLVVLIKRQVGRIDGLRILDSALRVVGPTAVLTAALYGGVWLLERALGVEGKLAQAAIVFAPMLLAGLLFIGTCRLVRVRELASAWSLIARRLRRAGS
jgi:putative peptidoglycan lipid II flippase